MNIVAFTKRVPVTQEEELKILREGEEVDLSRTPYRMNDWDNYAVEEAVRIVEKVGGDVTSVSIGDMESDEVLRRAIAMGAKDGILLEVEKPLHDPFIRAEIMYNLLKRENIAFDAVFTGVQAEDDQFAATGGILAAKLRVPYVSMVIAVDETEKEYMVVRRELEGGMQERVKVSLPSVLSIQSGINEPRYVSIMGVRKASKVERKYLKAQDYINGATPKIEAVKWVYPPKREGATLIQGEPETVCKQLIAILKEKGVYQ